MTAAFDRWLPFRRPVIGQGGDRVSARIRREIIGPLADLLGTAAAPGSEIPGPLTASLETVLGVVGESFAAADSAGTVETLDQAWQGWELKLHAFAREGGEVRMQRLGKPPALAGEPARQLFLAVREAIGNAMRHAAARRIEVVLVPWQAGCAVTVADDGRGMPEAAGGGIGLATMRRRMARCGGELRVHPAEGTVVEFRLPSPSFDCWSWLLASGRIARGVAAAHAAAVTRRWQERVDRCGGLERIFADWPRDAAWVETRTAPEDRGPAAFAEIPGWLGRRIAAMGGPRLAGVADRGDRLVGRIAGRGDIDPLHWLDLGLDLSLAWPVLPRRAGDDGIEIVVARQAGLLPAPEAEPGFAHLVHQAWSGGISDLRADLSSYLHDVLAQELVAESMRWEIAREACPPSALRSRFDQCRHELRRIAMLARSLSHELDES
jgi:signal transduction histidine kinase